MIETPWYASFFGEEYLRVFGGQMEEERTTAEVEGIVRLLDLPQGSSVLDLACGQGRHAIRLAERGYRVTGLDLSDVLLEQGRLQADARGQQIRWVHADMREIPFEAEFDAVINVYSAFGYLENDDEDQRVLEQVQRALKPGSALLIETLHRDALVRGFERSSVTRHDDGLLVTHERHFDLPTGRGGERITLIYPDGRRSELTFDVRVYTPTELAALLARAALSLLSTYGGLDGHQLTLDSRRMVVIARKDSADSSKRTSGRAPRPTKTPVSDGT
jgi:SAM-dependent methyltransferase